MTHITYNPAFGVRMASPMDPEMFRVMSQGTVWRFNPWTGAQRDQADIAADPFGTAIVPPQVKISAIELEINELASEARIGMQTLHQHTINLLAVGIAKKLDDLIRAGLDRVLGEWSLETVGAEGLACTRNPDGSSVYEVRGIPFLLVRETRLAPDGRPNFLTAGFEYRYLVDESGQPKVKIPSDESDAPAEEGA